MKSSRKTWGFVIVGAVAAVTLGAIAVASAATSQSPAPSPAGSAQAGTVDRQDGRDFGRGGPGDFAHGGPGDLAEALAALSGKDQSTIETQRDAGKSYAAVAQAYGVSTDALLAKATSIEQAELDAAVEAGTITDAQRTEALSGLQTRLEEELNATGTRGHGGPGGGHGGGAVWDGGAAASGTTQST